MLFGLSGLGRIGLSYGDWTGLRFCSIVWVWLEGRVCDVFSFMRYRYACEVMGSEMDLPRLRDGILFVKTET